MAYLAPILSRLRAEEHAAVTARAVAANNGNDGSAAYEAGEEGGPAEAGNGELAEGTLVGVASGEDAGGMMGSKNRGEEEREEVLLFQKPNRPRALVLVPTRELVQQVIASAKELCHDAPFRAVG
jgi:hypothetical protein